MRKLLIVVAVLFSAVAYATVQATDSAFTAVKARNAKLEAAIAEASK